MRKVHLCNQNSSTGEADMAVKTTLKSISTALEVVEEKKSKLRKAFEELQSNSVFLSSSPAFTNLKWEDIDSHFTSFHSDIVQKFSLLQSQISQSLPESTLEGEKELNPVSVQPELKSSENQESQPLVGSTSKGKEKLKSDSVRPELKSFFQKMDGLGLRKYIVDRRNQRGAIRNQMVDAWKYAPDPAMMVLSAMQGFFRDDSSSGSGRSADLVEARTGCVLLLEEFMKAKLEIGSEAEEKARALATEWKEKIGVTSTGSGNAVTGEEVLGRVEGSVTGDEVLGRLERLGFLHLLAAFGLVKNNEYDMNELVEYIVGVARHRQAVELCHFLGLGERVFEVVHKLIGQGEKLLAVKFILQFELTDKFPPLPLLEDYISDSKDLAEKVQKSAKNDRQAMNEAAAKEISSLRSVIKIIEDRNLDSEYPKDILLSCVKKLEKVKTSGKRAATGPAAKGQQPSKKMKKFGTKHRQRNGAAGLSAVHKKVTVSATAPSLPQRYVQTAGLLTDPYAAYASGGSAPVAVRYEGAPAGMYGLPGRPIEFSGNLDPSVSSLYPSESRPSYYQSSLVYGIPGLQSQYHPAYYPQ